MAVLVIESPNELIPWPNSTTRKSRLSRSRAVARLGRRRRGREVDRAPPRARRAGDDDARLGALLRCVVTLRGYRWRRVDAGQNTPWEYAVAACYSWSRHAHRDRDDNRTDDRPTRRPGGDAAEPAATAPRTRSADLKINFGADDGAAPHGGLRPRSAARSR